MKVRCITPEELGENYTQWHEQTYDLITPNKLYDVIETTPNRFYVIIANDNNYHSIDSIMFEPLRNINLDLLLESV